MVRVTVSVPVPSPLRRLNPAASDGVACVTPNAGGSIVLEKANRYRPFSVATVHVRGPSSPEAASGLELRPANASRPAAKATGTIRDNRSARRESVLGALDV